jgi:hypothetical protein
LQFLSRAQSDWAETWWGPRVWFQDLFVFYIVNKQKNRKNAEIAEIAKIAVLQNLRFLHRAESD